MNVNRWRNWALVCMFGGFFVMYCGVYVRFLLPVLTAIGGISALCGILMYFRFGPVNPRVVKIPCPRCGMVTALTGEQDACQHCEQPLQRVENGFYEPYLPEP